jgi:predicted DsbA family dithiol-disulfide isomerase
LDLPWINLRDASGQIARNYDVTAVPTKFVIDKEGLIVARNPEDIEQILRELSQN